MLLDRPAQVIGRPGEGAGIARLDQDDELFTTPSDDVILFSEGLPEGCGELLENRVSDEVPPGIVDLFEIVGIAEENSELTRGGSLDDVADVFFEELPVVDSGQRVMEHFVFEPVLRFGGGADVGKYDDELSALCLADVDGEDVEIPVAILHSDDPLLFWEFLDLFDPVGALGEIPGMIQPLILDKTVTQGVPPAMSSSRSRSPKNFSSAWLPIRGV